VGACPTVETERLVLRPFRESDLDALTRVMQAPAVRASLHLPDDVGREEAWSGMAASLGQWELRGTGQWAAIEKASGELVGRVGSHWPERADWPGIEIGWSLHPDHWGKGYATEGGRATIGYVFEHHDVTEVFSVILEDNVRSQAVARRLGFELFETRVTAHFPTAPHGIWRLPRQRVDTQRVDT